VELNSLNAYNKKLESPKSYADGPMVVCPFCKSDFGYTNKKANCEKCGRIFHLFLFRTVHNILKYVSPRFIPGTFVFIKDKYSIDIQISTDNS